MAQAFTKFQAFTHALGLKKHNLDTDDLRIQLLATAPSASLDAEEADLPADLTTGGGYTATTGLALGSGITYTTSSGTATLAATPDPFTFTTSADVGPFRYAVLYNNTATNKDLIGYWDLGSDITIVNGSTLELDFNVLGVLTIV